MDHRATCEGEIEEGTDLGNILVTGLRTRDVHLCVVNYCSPLVPSLSQALGLT